MRILIVSEDVPYASMGGLAKHALNLARALIKQGHTVDFLGGDQHPIDIAGAEGQFGGRFIGELSGHLAGWKEKRLGLFNPMRRTWVAKRFARTIKKYAPDYDVVHYHGHFPNLAKFIPTTIRFIQTRHDQGSDCLTHTRFKENNICTTASPVDCASCITREPNYLQQKISANAVIRYRNEVASGFNKHPTIFVSELLKTNLTRTLGDKNWGKVIHHFIDADALEIAESTPIRLPDAKTNEIVVSGKIYPPKGIAKLAELCSTRFDNNYRLVVVGNGPELNDLRKRLSSPNVLFMGWCDPLQTLQITAGADIVVVPSLWEEPFGGTTLEGLLLGKPTLALARGASFELHRYARYPGQLKLYSDLEKLVSDIPNIAVDNLKPKTIAAQNYDNKDILNAIMKTYQH